VGQHPTIVKLMKGAFNQRPSQSKYLVSIYHISSMGVNHFLPLKSLSLKLVILLALSRPSRSHDLCNLDLRYMKSLSDVVEFKPSSLAKWSRPFEPAASFVSPLIRNSALRRHYLNMFLRPRPTEAMDQTKKTKLFLSYVKPHNQISSSSIVRWILAMLSLADTDTE